MYSHNVNYCITLLLFFLNSVLTAFKMHICEWETNVVMLVNDFSSKSQQLNRFYVKNVISMENPKWH